MSDLRSIVKKYFEFRGYKYPTATEAFLWTASELGEVADAMNQRRSSDWVRNNPDEKHAHVEKEIGDVLMMLTILAMHYGIDPVDAMLENMKEKGFQL